MKKKEGKSIGRREGGEGGRREVGRREGGRKDRILSGSSIFEELSLGIEH